MADPEAKRAKIEGDDEVDLAGDDEETLTVAALAQLEEVQQNLDKVRHNCLGHFTLPCCFSLAESFPTLKVNDEASDKVLEVEQAFNKIRRPIYQVCCLLTSGGQSSASLLLTSNLLPFQKRNTIIQNVPNFWVTTLLHHPVLQEMSTDDDVQILGRCTEVRSAV